jgi:hypothetical protein
VFTEIPEYLSQILAVVMIMKLGKSKFRNILLEGVSKKKKRDL